MDAADTLAAIAEKIQSDRRTRTQLARGCPNCDD
jgi:hypothetical protein